MTPKEKAIELINKYNLIILDTALGGSNKKVKQCAFIAVDEIIKIAPNDISIFGTDFLTIKEYWQRVKEEIQNL